MFNKMFGKKIKKIDSKSFNFNFFLSARIKVNENELVENTVKYGGSTLFSDGLYCSIPENDYIQVLPEKNKISVFVPSTNNVDELTDNSKIVNDTIEKISKKYSLTNLSFYDTQGSWLSENGNCIIENITIIELELNSINKKDITFFVNIANWIKKEMSQEGVSISVNSALCII